MFPSPNPEGIAATNGPVTPISTRRASTTSGDYDFYFSPIGRSIVVLSFFIIRNLYSKK